MPWPLPANLTTEAKRRARVLLADVRGPLLDLGGSVSPIACGDWGTPRALEVTSLGSVSDPTTAVERLAQDRGAGAFVEVVGVMVTPQVRDLSRLFGGIAALLDDDGRFLFVEPDAVSGSWSGVVAPAIRSIAGLEVGRDITGAMWDSGLSVGQIDRRPVPRAPWPVRNLVSGFARLVPPDDSRRRT